MDNFLRITTHLINDDWFLKEELLTFKLSNEAHSGKSLANIVFKVLQQFDLVKKGKLGWFTTDNGPNNDTVMAELEKLLCNAGILASN
ncbi:hypothetical protein AAF712_012245 [Marasmius tenuissimus]|uniref:DUF4371 domain-containing protein n=1 Tax=Marasmius tenuissimus TaxID=585030 RepID=A0ABR2ZIB7_9AGAR